MLEFFGVATLLLALIIAVIVIFDRLGGGATGHEEWVAVAVAAYLLLMGVAGVGYGLKGCSEEVRIGHLKRAQYNTCLRQSQPPEKCQKIVDLEGD